MVQEVLLCMGRIHDMETTDSLLEWLHEHYIHLHGDLLIRIYSTFFYFADFNERYVF
jgi:hypothetical protein